MIGFFPRIILWRVRRGPSFFGISATTRLSQNEKTDPADGGPEECPHPPGKSQRQSNRRAQAEHLGDQYVSTLEGPEISRVDAAYQVHKFGHRFDDKGAQETKLHSHETENQTNLQHGHEMRRQGQKETSPKCAGGIVVKIQKCILNGLNENVFCFDPFLKKWHLRKKPRAFRNDLPALPHSQQGQ